MHIHSTFLKRCVTQQRSKTCTVQYVSQVETVNVFQDDIASRFYSTLHQCFAEHYPLGICPDALLWLVLHEIGITVNMYPDHYRSVFTVSDKKELIEVRHDALRVDEFNQRMEWAETIILLYAKLSKKVPSDFCSIAFPEFTTYDVDSMIGWLVGIIFIIPGIKLLKDV